MTHLSPRPSTPSLTSSSPLRFRQPRRRDGARLLRLVRACPPLETNSQYLYLLLTEHFSQTCMLVEQDDDIVGFISAYRRPDAMHTLFIWQVAVRPDMRGRGLGLDMLRALLSRPSLHAISALEATVAPDNRASRRLFEGFARERDWSCEATPLFAPDDFGGEVHEPEFLLRLRRKPLVSAPHPEEATWS